MSLCPELSAAHAWLQNEGVVGTTPADVMQLVMFRQYMDMLREASGTAHSNVFVHGAATFADIQKHMREAGEAKAQLAMPGFASLQAAAAALAQPEPEPEPEPEPVGRRRP